MDDLHLSTVMNLVVQNL